MKRLLFALAFVVLATPSVAQPAVDEIDPAAITWHGSAPVHTWPITARLDGLEWRPGAGLIPRYASGALNAWPDGVPPGWEGPVYYTLWACVPISGRYHCGGFILFWRGREHSGAHWLEPAPGREDEKLDNWRGNWADARSATAYPPMSSYVPREGDEVGFLLAAGGNRVGEVFTKAERTQIIKVKVRHSGVEWASLPAPSGGTGRTTGGVGAGAGSGGLPPPSPQPSPGPNVSAELNALVSLLTELSVQIERLSAQQDAKFEAARHQQSVDTDKLLQALQARPVVSPQPVPLPDVQRLEQLLKERDGHGAGFYVMEILKAAGSIAGALAAAGVIR